MRGARPELRIVEPDQDANLHLEKDSAAECLPVPDGIPAPMHAEWRAIVSDLKERRLLNDSMLGVVRSYVMAQWTAAEAEKSIAEHGVFVKGAGGASKPNPATGLLRSSRDMITRLASELGLTPTARSRKSLQPAHQGELFKPGAPGSEWDL